MTYEVVLDTFNGPLDLLLHLIEKQEMSIHDIQISVIADQYLTYLRTMEELSLEVASEFLLMAATLLWIKSRMLLPRTPVMDTVDEQVETDPRSELILQLVEYQQAKWAAEQLTERGLVQSRVYARQPMDLRRFAQQAVSEYTVTLSIWDLVDCLRNLLTRSIASPPVAHITGKVISVEEKMEELVIYLRRMVRSSFAELTWFAHSRSEIVTTFLALLELVKVGSVRCVQSLGSEDIAIEWLERTSD